MFTREAEHSVILLVNARELIVGDVLLSRKTPKKSYMQDFWSGCRGENPRGNIAAFGHAKRHVVPDVNRQAPMLGACRPRPHRLIIGLNVCRLIPD